jgi:hypothetical protein
MKMDIKGERLIVLMAVFGLLVGPAIPASAGSFCMAPHAPSFYSSKPSRPYCVTSRSCSSWEVQSYRNSVDGYFRQLEQYASYVSQFNRQSNDYIECMSDLD